MTDVCRKIYQIGDNMKNMFFKFHFCGEERRFEKFNEITGVHQRRQLHEHSKMVLLHSVSNHIPLPIYSFPYF